MQPCPAQSYFSYGDFGYVILRDRRPYYGSGPALSGLTDQRAVMEKYKIKLIIRIAILVSTLVTAILVLKKPAPVARPQAPAAIAEHAQSFDQKMADFQQAIQQSSSSSGAAVTPAAASEGPKPEIRITSDEAGAVLAQSLANTSELKPDSNVGNRAQIKDELVSFEGDVVHGQFLTEIAGKDVWITISGHLGENDGYATFDPTEFKVGDLSVPVSLVNPALQKKLTEERDRLKLPDNVGGLRIENGELVMQGR